MSLGIQSISRYQHAGQIQPASNKTKNQNLSQSSKMSNPTFGISPESRNTLFVISMIIATLAGFLGLAYKVYRELFVPLLPGS